MKEVIIDNGLNLSNIREIWVNIKDQIDTLSREQVCFNFREVHDFDDSGLQFIIFLICLSRDNRDCFFIEGINQVIEQAFIKSGFDYDQNSGEKVK